MATVMLAIEASPSRRCVSEVRLVAGGGEGIRDNRGVRDLPMRGEEGANNGVRGSVCDGGRGGSDIVWLKWSKERRAKKQGQIRPPGGGQICPSSYWKKNYLTKKEGQICPGAEKKDSPFNPPVHRQEFFIPYKPIGAAPGCNYYLKYVYLVAKRMVRTTTNLVGIFTRCTVCTS
jgi:hypothetical protein